MKLLPPASTDAEGVANMLSYWEVVCNQPIESECLAVAREAALNALAVNIADMGGSKYLRLAGGLYMVMDYDLKAFGRTVIYEMVLRLSGNPDNTGLCVRDMELNASDVLTLYCGHVAVTMVVPGLSEVYANNHLAREAAVIAEVHAQVEKDRTAYYADVAVRSEKVNRRPSVIARKAKRAAEKAAKAGAAETDAGRQQTP